MKYRDNINISKSEGIILFWVVICAFMLILTSTGVSLISELRKEEEISRTFGEIRSRITNIESYIKEREVSLNQRGIVQQNGDASSSLFLQHDNLVDIELERTIKIDEKLKWFRLTEVRNKIVEIKLESIGFSDPMLIATFAQENDPCYLGEIADENDDAEGTWNAQLIIEIKDEILCVGASSFSSDTRGRALLSIKQPKQVD